MVMLRAIGMRLLYWIFMVPIAVAVIALAASNRGAVSLYFGSYRIGPDLPLFAVVLASAFAGYIVGGVVSWIAGAGARRRARASAREAEAARRELALLHERVRDLEDAADDRKRGRARALAAPKSDAAA